MYLFVVVFCIIFFFFKQKTAYEMRISDWSSDVCSSDLDWIKAEIEQRMGEAFELARPFHFESNGDRYGWTETADGRHHLTLFIENGRLLGKLMDGLRDVARIHRGTFRLTPNQNLIIAGVKSEDRPAIEAVLQEYGIGEKSVSMVRRNSMACVALPTCALAMAESERYLPDLKIGRAHE